MFRVSIRHEQITLEHLTGTRTVRNSALMSVSDTISGTVGEPWTATFGICNGLSQASQTYPDFEWALAAINGTGPQRLSQTIAVTLVRADTGEELGDGELPAGTTVLIESIAAGPGGAPRTLLCVDDDGTRRWYTTDAADF